MKRIYFYILITLLIFTGCEEVEIPNYNQPNRDQVLANADDYPSVLNGAYLSWWNALHKDNPYMTLSVAGNHGSSSWGNFGMQDVGTVAAPYGLGDHSAINNTETDPRAPGFLETPWYNLYGALTTANDIMVGTRINGNKVNDSDDITKQTEAQALFIRGLSYGFLGLLYDRGFVVTQDNYKTIVLDETGLSPYTDLRNQAISDLEEMISIATGLGSFEIAQFNGLTLTKEQSIALAKSYIAKFIAQTPRDAAENSAADWAKVKTMTEEGIDFDFAPIGDGGTNWWHAYFRHGNHIWMRLDQQVVNMVDAANNPYPFPESGSYTVPTAFPDARFGDADSDAWFTLAGNPIFRPGRGLYFFSYFKFNKYSAYLADLSLPMVSLTSEDNDLLLAEALIRTGGDLGKAASLINKTRVTNGHLSAATAADSDLLEKVFYERYLEAYETPGGPFYDRRRRDDLGEKQFKQFPIPAKELNTILMPLYTFGG